MGSHFTAFAMTVTLGGIVVTGVCRRQAYLEKKEAEAGLKEAIKRYGRSPPTTKEAKAQIEELMRNRREVETRIDEMSKQSILY